MNNPVKLFIVEGEDRDYRFVNEMSFCFFSKGKFEAKVINLPASQNIYMLYRLLKEDDFDTDIVEILRDTVDVAKEKLEGVDRQDIDEVYLFFDYDVHQNNLSHENKCLSADDVVTTMLEVFDNETENGKLYISYPMVEALYDYKEGMCEAYSGCLFDINSLNKYKEASGRDNPNASIHFSYAEWKHILNIFVVRIMCLFGIDDVSFEFFRENVSPLSIFKKENELKKEDNEVFILSAFPEFIFDYFKIDFWNTHAKMKKKKYAECSRVEHE